MTLRLSACVEMIFGELPFAERLERVAAAGLPAFEFWGLKDKDVPAIAAKQRELGLECAAFVGTGGVPLVDAIRRGEFLGELRKALDVANRLDCCRLIATTGNDLAGIPRSAQFESVVAALRAAAPLCKAAGVTLVLEPLNVLVDHKGYFLPSSGEAFAILEEVGSTAVKLLYDVYHQQITEGNLIATMTANAGRLGHIHVADVPGRHEPGTGEINYGNVFRALDVAGYGGFVGLEYRPKSDAAATLRAVRALI